MSLTYSTLDSSTFRIARYRQRSLIRLLYVQATRRREKPPRTNYSPHCGPAASCCTRQCDVKRRAIRQFVCHSAMVISRCQDVKVSVSGRRTALRLWLRFHERRVKVHQTSIGRIIIGEPLNWNMLSQFISRQVPLWRVYDTLKRRILGQWPKFILNNPWHELATSRYEHFVWTLPRTRCG